MGKSLLSFCSRLLLAVALVCLPMTALADDVTVFSGTQTTSFVPVFGSWVDSYTRTQILYPADSLAGVAAGSSVESLTFYAGVDSKTWGAASFNIYLTETTGVSLSSGYVDLSTATLVYSGSVSISNALMTITFDTPYTYNGGDLIIDFSQQATGTYSTAGIYGINNYAAGSSIYGYSASGAASASGTSISFVPQLTISFEPPAGSCPRPGVLAVSDITSTTANISWGAATGVSSYELKILNGTNVEQSYILSDTVKALTGLSSATDYSVKVRSICGANDSSSWRSGKFTTACATITSLPWKESFSGSSLPNCWTVSGTTANASYNWSSYTTGYTGKGVRFNSYSNSTGNTGILETPDIAIPAAGYELTFLCKNPAGGDFDVLVAESGSATQANLLTGLTAISDWTKKIVDLSAYAGKTINIYFVGTSNYGSGDAYLYLDEVEVRETPSCRPGTDLKLAGVTKTSATFSWTPANGETDWEVHYKSSTDAAYQSATVSTNSITIEGLTASTVYKYDIHLLSLCGGVQSPDSNCLSIQFSSECDLIEAVNDTIKMGFENYDNNSVDDLPCWLSYTANNADACGWTVQGNSIMSGIKLLAGGVIEENVPAIAIFPEVNLPEGSEVTLKTQKYVSYYDADTLSVYYNSAASLDGATFLGKFTADTYQKSAFHRFQLTGFRNGGHLILVVNGPSQYQKVLVDDVTFEPAPSCLPPTDLKQTGLTPESVTFSWTPGASETAWNFTAQDTLDLYEEAAVENTPSFTIEGLTPATTYTIQVTVQSHCSATDESVETIDQEVTFTTPCNALDGSSYNAGDTVYAYSFESTESEAWEAGWVDSEHPCFINTTAEGASTLYGEAYKWTVGAGPTSYGSVTNGPHTGSQALYLANGSYYSASADALFVLPGVTTENAGDFELSLYTAAGNSYSWSSYADSLKVWVNNAPSLTGATLLIAENHPETTYSQYSAVIPLTGTVYVIIEGKTSQFSLLVDDIVLRRLPSCRKVQNVRIENVTETTANLAWTPGNNESAWNLQIVNGADTLVNAQVTDSVYSLIGLTDGTDYSYKVRVAAVCDGVEAAEVYTGTLDFVTKCYPVVISVSNSWSESFDARAVGDIDFPCWVNEHIAGSATSVFQVYNDSYGTGDNTSNMGKLPDQQKGNITLLSLPNMTIPEADAYEFKISVYRSAEGTNYTAEGLRIFDNDTELGFISRNCATADSAHGIPAEASIDWYTYTFTLPIAGATTIKIQGESQYGTSTYFDDLAVRKIPTCVGATAATVIDSLKTSNSVTLGWSGEAANYKVSYATSDSAIVGNAMVSEPKITISNLAASTQYNFNIAVVAVCSETDEAADTLKTTLSAQTECQTVASFPWSEDFENYNAGDFAGACWTNEHITGSGSQIFKIYTYGNGSNSTHTCYLPDQSSGTITLLSLPEMNIPTSNSYEFLISVYRNTNSTSYAGEGLRIYADTVELGFISRNYEQADATHGIPAESEMGWYDYSLTIPSSGLTHLKIQGENKYGSATYFDNIVVRKLNSCQKPDSLQADSVTTTSAYLSWTGSNDAYKVIIRSAAGDTLVNTITANKNLEISGLAPATRYTLNTSLYGICGSDTSYAYESQLIISTACLPLSTFPWSTSFETSEGFVSYASVDNASCFSTTAINVATGAATSNVWQTTGTAHTGSLAAYARYLSSTNTEATLYLPEMIFDGAKTYKVTYYYYYNNSNYGDSLLLKVTNGVNETLCLDTVALESTNYEWVERTAYINGTDGVSQVSFVFKTNDGYYAYLDDVTIEEDEIATSERSIYGNIDEQVTKFVRDGHVYILYRGVIYNALGQKVEIVK